MGRGMRLFVRTGGRVGSKVLGVEAVQVRLEAYAACAGLGIKMCQEAAKGSSTAEPMGYT